MVQYPGMGDRNDACADDDLVFVESDTPSPAPEAAPDPTPKPKPKPTPKPVERQEQRKKGLQFLQYAGLLGSGLALRNTERVWVETQLAGLVDGAGEADQVALAESLAAQDRVSGPLAMKLATGSLEASKCLLTHENADSQVLAAAAMKGSSAHQTLIAQRKGLSQDCVEILAKKGSRAAASALLDNRTAFFSQSSYLDLSRRAEADPLLQKKILERKDLSPVVAHEMFWQAHPVLRQLIVQKHQPKPDQLREILEQGLAEGLLDGDIEELMKAYLHPDRNWGCASIDELVSMLRANEWRRFCKTLAEITGAEHPVLDKMLKDGSGEGLAVACRAGTISVGDFTKLFLQLDYHQHHETRPLSHIRTASKVFSKVTPAQAKSSVGLWNVSCRITH